MAATTQMSRAEGGGEGAFKRCVNARVKGVIDEDMAAAAVIKIGSGRSVRALCHFLAHVGLTAGKTAPDIYYQANTNGRYESLSYISHIASVFSLLGSVFKRKVRLHQSLK